MGGLAMEPKEVIAELDSMEEGMDEEICHGRADSIVMVMLMDSTDPEMRAVAQAWYAARDRVGFWYA